MAGYSGTIMAPGPGCLEHRIIMQAARFTVLVVTLTMALKSSAIAGPIYTLKDLGVVSSADLVNYSNDRIYITASGQIEHGTAPSQGPYTLGIDNSNADTSGSIGYVTPTGGTRITIAPPSGWAFTTVMPEEVNPSGEVVGYAYGAVPTRAVIFQVGGTQGVAPH